MDLKSLLTNPYVVSLLFSSIVTLILYYSRDRTPKNAKPMSYYIFVFIVSCTLVYSAFFMYRKIGRGVGGGGAAAAAAVAAAAVKKVTEDPVGTPSTPSTPKASLLSGVAETAKSLMGGGEQPMELPTEPIMVGML
jgi:hypothetical protein